jgi:hypothetical protein
MTGWRKIKDIYRTLKSQFRKTPSSGIQRQKRGPEKAVCKGVFKLNLARVSLMYIL